LQRPDLIDAQLAGHAHNDLKITADHSHQQHQLRLLALLLLQAFALLSPAVAAQLGLMQAALAIDDGKGAATPQPQNFLEVVPLIAGEFQLLSAAG